jgi:hypothetical protein
MQNGLPDLTRRAPQRPLWSGRQVPDDAISVAGSDAPPIRSRGQHIWRYHPERRVYEIFAEGGGNIWSCQFDAQGCLFAGTNEGNTVAYHYMPGAYYKKNFGKHGQLSNPYALGHFPGIATPGLPRVTTNVLCYDADGLPARYRGALFACNPLTSRVNAIRLGLDGPRHIPQARLTDRCRRPLVSARLCRPRT